LAEREDDFFEAAVGMATEFTKGGGRSGVDGIRGERFRSAAV